MLTTLSSEKGIESMLFPSPLVNWPFLKSSKAQWRANTNINAWILFPAPCTNAAVPWNLAKCPMVGEAMQRPPWRKGTFVPLSPAKVLCQFFHKAKHRALVMGGAFADNKPTPAQPDTPTSGSNHPPSLLNYSLSLLTPTCQCQESQMSHCHMATTAQPALCTISAAAQ